MAATESAIGEAARTIAAGAMLTASGPLLADYTTMALCGALGAAIKIGSTPAIKSSFAEALWAVAIGIAAAILFGWFAAHYVSRWTGEAVGILTVPLAGVLGLIGRDWPAVVKAVWRWRTQRSADGGPT